MGFEFEGPAWKFWSGAEGKTIGGTVDLAGMRVLARWALAFTILTGTVRGMMSLRNSRLSLWETAEAVKVSVRGGYIGE